MVNTTRLLFLSRLDTMTNVRLPPGPSDLYHLTYSTFRTPQMVRLLRVYEYEYVTYTNLSTYQYRGTRASWAFQYQVRSTERTSRTYVLTVQVELARDRKLKLRWYIRTNNTPLTCA